MFRTAARTALAVVAALVAALALTAGPAWAHNELKSSDPANGASLATVPVLVTLTFQEALDPKTELTVTGPGGVAAGSKVTVAGPTVSTPFTGSAVGVYTVAYKTVSDDGDPITGNITFTLTAVTPPSLSPKPAPSPEPSPVVTSAAAPTSASVTATTTGSTTNKWPWILGGVAVILVGAVVVYVLRQRRA